MPEEFENSEARMDAKTAKTLAEGLSLLQKMAESKYIEKQAMVTIVLNGLPNSGKTKLRSLFQNTYAGYSNDRMDARSVTGLREVAELQKEHSPQNPRLPSKYLIIEDVSSAPAIEKIAKSLGLIVDIYIYIYNPNFEKYTSFAEKIRADIIIMNPDSIKK